MVKKRLSIIILLLLSALLLAACKAEPAEPPAGEAPAEEQQPAEEQEAAPVEEEAAPAEEEVVTIDFWIPSGRGRDEGIAAVVEAFEAQNPNIKVEITAIPFGEFLNSLTIALAGDDPPDASLTNGVDIQGLAFRGALLPLDDMVSEADRQDFMADLVEMVTFDGKMYGIPFQQASAAMYYNADYFEAAGIEVPQTLDEAWTWPEFVDNVKLVMADQEAKGNKIWGMVGLTNPIRSTFFAWTIVRSNSEPGQPLWQGISPDWTTVKGYIDTPEAMEAYRFYQSLYLDGFAPQDDVPDAFGTGQAATYFAIPPTGAVLKKNFPELNWGVTPLPFLKTPITHTGSFAPTVAAKSDNPEAAKKFIGFLTSPEGYLVYHSVTPIIPGRKSLQAQIPELQEGYLKLLFEEVVEWGVSRPGGPAHSIFNQIVAQDMMINIALGADIEQAVAQAIAEADAQLAQFKR